ncbi:MAG: TolC family protein [Deltaproteobacteria bacterium]|nr:TolC family protein [Deltaproteobacteria bacterium]
MLRRSLTGLGLGLFFIATLATAGPAALAADQVRELTLAECVRLAVESNTDLAKGKLDRSLSQLDRRIGQTYFHPDLYLYPETDYRTDDDGRLRFILGTDVVQRIPTGGQVTLGWDNSFNRYTGLSEQDWTSRFSIKFNQPLLRGAGLEVGRSPVVLSGLDDDEDRLGYEWLITRQITQVQKRYWDLLLAEENLKVAQQALDQNRRWLEEARKRNQPDEILDLEAEVADSELDVSERLLSEARANLRLLDLLDLPGVRRIKPKGRFEFKPVEVDLDRCLKTALEKRPDFNRTKVLVDSARLKAVVARSNAKQDLDLTVEAATNATEDDFGEAVKAAFDLGQEWIFSLGAEVRFGVPGRNRDAVAADYRYRKAKLDLKERLQSVRNDVTTAVYSLQRSLKSIALAQRAVKLAREKLSAARQRLIRGQGNNLKVVIYQRDLTEARLREARSIVQYLADLADLDQAMGTTLDTWRISLAP